ncbi:hypothetical protein AVEN_258809-1 [Araneus ventricosus]|uniref:Uncharacterized protein n=1 Tax=Araneus ventricosus TaxID=182803 RepID=A0A4Y2UBQ5_ARAVE|nr:hypothetical protein AVEN_258809-1 [Araneus ventricosus]
METELRNSSSPYGVFGFIKKNKVFIFMTPTETELGISPSPYAACRYNTEIFFYQKELAKTESSYYKNKYTSLNNLPSECHYTQGFSKNCTGYKWI